MGINPSLPPEYSGRFPGREDLQIDYKNGAATIVWSPKGPTLDKSCLIEFRVKQSDLTPVAVFTMVSQALGDDTAEVGSIANPLGSSFAKRMMESSHIGRIESCTIDNLTIASAQIDRAFSLKDVKIRNSCVALRGKQLNFDGVAVTGSTLYLESEGGTFDAVHIDEASTIAGDLGSTFIKKDCTLKGYAVELKMNYVTWDEPDTVVTRTQGMYMRSKYVDPEVFTPERVKAVTAVQLREECIKRNSYFPVDRALSALTGPPVFGIKGDGEKPLSPELEKLGVKQTIKVGYCVEPLGGASQPFLTEFSVANPATPFAPSLLYKVVGPNRDLQPEVKTLTNQMMVAEVLKRILDHVPPPFDRAPTVRPKRSLFDPSQLSYGSVGDLDDPFSSLWTKDTDSGIHRVI